MSAGGAAVAAMIQAIKASGAIVRVDSSTFSYLVQKTTGALVITAEGWAFGKRYKYFTSYKGLAFYTSTGEPLQLPSNAEVIPAQSMWMPG
jgi:hypothetical protein